MYIVTVGNCQDWQKRAKELSRALHLAPQAKRSALAPVRLSTVT